MMGLLKLVSFVVLLAVLFIFFSPTGTLDPTALRAARAAYLLMSLIALVALATPRIFPISDHWRCQGADPQRNSMPSILIIDLDGARIC